MRYQLRDMVVFSGRSLMLIVILMCGLASTTAFAGQIILGGDDLDYHGNYNSGTGPNQKGWIYIQRALASMYKAGCFRPGNDGSIAVLGAPLSTLPNGTATSGGHAGAAIHFAGNVALGKVVNYYDGVIGINSFFTALSAGTVNPAIIYIPSSDFDAVDGISTAEGGALTAHANDLKTFVNSGGALMAHIDGTNTGGWVTTVTGVTVNIVCNSTGATLTAAGTAAFTGLSNSDIDGTAGPCHATFTGTLGGLSVLALDGGSPAVPARNYIVGGGCGTVIVTPGTLCCPPWNSTTLSNSMFYQGSGGFSQPYTLKFQPSATVNTQMEAYVAYIHALYPTVTTLTNTFNLQNGGTGNTCSASGPSTVGTATWTSSTVTLSPLGFYAGFPMVVNNWYKVSTVTTLNGTHPPLDATCIDNWMCFRIQVVPSPKAMPGHGQSEPTLQMRLPDGRMIERALSTKMTPN
jgi:hypothetical protein